MVATAAGATSDEAALTAAATVKAGLMEAVGMWVIDRSQGPWKGHSSGRSSDRRGYSRGNVPDHGGSRSGLPSFSSKEETAGGGLLDVTIVLAKMEVP